MARKKRAKVPRKRGLLREEILNAPNLVTLARIALIPLFLVLLLDESRRNSFYAALVFGFASATDYVDGYLARKLKLITTFGKFIDPLADKLITMSAYIACVHLARLPAWVAIVIIGRELIISGLRTVAMSEGIVIAASQGGKWKTALQLVGIVGLVVHYRYEVDLLVWTGPVDFQVVGDWLTYLSLVYAITSGVDYFRGFVGGVFAARKASPPGPASGAASGPPSPSAAG